jgi:Spy/CpxP family protein refolding chaperone
MKRMLISIMGISLIPMSIAFAAGNPVDETSNWFEKKIGRYYQDLNLTEQQKVQLRDIHQKHRLAEDKEVMGVLTPEQQKKWDELKNSRKSTYLQDNVDDLKKE